MTHAESHFHTAETQRIRLDKKSFTRGLMVSRISFSGQKNVVYATTGSHGTLCRVSQEIEKTYFQAIKMTNNNSTKARYL
jgi:hypothetical protein